MIDIVFCIPCLLTGGTEVATLDTAKAFIQLGHKVEVLVYFNEVDPSMQQTFTDAGVNVRLLGLTRKGGMTAALRLATALIRALWGRRYPLIWVQYMTPTLLPLLIARLFAHRLVAAVHVAAGHYSASGKRRLRSLARWWCDRFVCVSQTSAAGLFGKFSRDRHLAERVMVLPNSIDVDAVLAAPRRDWRYELGLPADALVVGYVGRLAHNKGVDVLLHAAALMSRTHPHVYWLIVGDGAERTELESFVGASGLTAHTHFIGGVPREDVYAAMKGFDIAVVPSREEGFGLTALEAMAAGVPVVASRVDALCEIVLDGRTGLLFAPEDPDSLAETLTRLIEDAPLRRALGTAGAAHAASSYGQSVYRQRIGEMLAGLGLEPERAV